MKSQSKVLTAVIVSGLIPANPVTAQDTRDQAIQRFERQVVGTFETALSRHTDKTASIIYLRRVSGSTRTGHFCGEAFFGTHRDRFIIDMAANSVEAPASSRAWEEASCDGRSPEGYTFIDLR